MQINVKLKGTTVTVSPSGAEVNGNGNQSLQWQMKDDSDQFDFDNPPITFDSSSAPITGISADGSNAGATDNVSVEGDFTYHVHLIDAQGNHITYPPTTSTARNTLTTSSKMMLGSGTDPTIKNRPN